MRDLFIFIYSTLLKFRKNKDPYDNIIIFVIFAKKNIKTTSHMKKILLIALLMNIAFVGFAQNTIKFLGIPIEGTKKEITSKLQAKGYEYDSYNDCLTGEFNGSNVAIYIHTVNNQVWRLCIVDDWSSSETDIKIRYNKLFEQFSSNGKYISVGKGKLTDYDDISYEMNVNKKRFEAVFEPVDKSINGLVWYMIREQYGEYRIYMFYENNDNAANGDDL